MTVNFNLAHFVKHHNIAKVCQTVPSNLKYYVTVMTKCALDVSAKLLLYKG